MESNKYLEEQTLDKEIDRIVNTWQSTLLRICYIHLQDHTLAEDAVQETLIKAFRNWDSFRKESSEQTWLIRIAINTCKDIQRCNWFHRINHKITPEMLPEATIQPNEENLDLTLAVMNLPIKFHEAIILYYYQDMNTVEISNVLGITQSSVSNRLKRGRELLSKALGGRDFDE